MLMTVIDNIADTVSDVSITVINITLLLIITDIDAKRVSNPF